MPLPDNEQATCLRATGTPGALALFRPHGTELFAESAATGRATCV